MISVAGDYHTSTKSNVKSSSSFIQNDTANWSYLWCLEVPHERRARPKTVEWGFPGGDEPKGCLHTLQSKSNSPRFNTTQLLSVLPVDTLRSWALIFLGHANHRLTLYVLKLFDSMLHPNNDHEWLGFFKDNYTRDTLILLWYHHVRVG